MGKRKNSQEMEIDAKEIMLKNDPTKDIDFTETTIDISVNNVLDEMTTFSVFRNLITLSISFMLLFSAFNSFVFLQSSLNKDDGLGTSGIACLYASMLLTNLFITPLTVSRCSEKWIMAGSMTTYIVYVCTGFYPTWSTIIPASIIIGFGAAHLWLAVQVYIIDIAKRYAILTKTDVQDRVHLFLGIFYAFTYASNIWGNLISSLVFKRKSIQGNTTTGISSLCGPNYCPYEEMNNSIFTPPTHEQVYIFTGSSASMAFLALLLIVISVTNTSSGGCEVTSVFGKLKQVTIQIFTSRNQILLTCASLLSGLANGFTTGDFTSAYISCPYGIENVGFVMITYGVSQSMFSVIFGKLNQYTGHIPIYVFGFMAQTSAYITVLRWSPRAEEYSVVYILAALFGLGAAINSPMVSALYNVYFTKDRDVAISSFRVLSAVGWTIATGYSSWLCTVYKVYALIGLLCLSLITIIRLDVLHRRDIKHSR